MEFQEKSIAKLCSFYVSDWHLVTMLLPYVHKKIEEKTKIATILEKDITENVDTLLERLKLKATEKVKDIKWENTDGKKYQNVKKIMERIQEENAIIIINGTKEFINNTNENIQKYLEKNKNQVKGKVTIINCYGIVEFNGSIEEILDRHDKILNTSGEKEITEIFEDYQRKIS